jgi:hypothetical protein
MHERIIVLLALLTMPTGCSAQIGSFWQEYKQGFNPIIRNEDGKVDKTFTLLTTSAVIANGLDLATTHWGISRGAHEANPMMRPLVNHEPAGAALKFGLIHPLIVLSAKNLSQYHGKKRILGGVLVGVSAGIYIWANVNNIRVIRRLRSIDRDEEAHHLYR